MTQSPLQLPCCSRKVAISCRSVSAVSSHPPAAESAPEAVGEAARPVSARRLLPSSLPSRAEGAEVEARANAVRSDHHRELLLVGGKRVQTQPGPSFVGRTGWAAAGHRRRRKAEGGAC